MRQGDLSWSSSSKRGMRLCAACALFRRIEQALLILLLITYVQLSFSTSAQQQQSAFNGEKSFQRQLGRGGGAYDDTAAAAYNDDDTYYDYYDDQSYYDDLQNGGGDQYHSSEDVIEKRNVLVTEDQQESRDNTNVDVDDTSNIVRVKKDAKAKIVTSSTIIPKVSESSGDDESIDYNISELLQAWKAYMKDKQVENGNDDQVEAGETFVQKLTTPPAPPPQVTSWTTQSPDEDTGVSNYDDEYEYYNQQDADIGFEYYDSNHRQHQFQSRRRRKKKRPQTVMNRGGSNDNNRQSSDPDGAFPNRFFRNKPRYVHRTRKRPPPQPQIFFNDANNNPRRRKNGGGKRKRVQQRPDAYNYPSYYDEYDDKNDQQHAVYDHDEYEYEQYGGGEEGDEFQCQPLEEESYFTPDPKQCDKYYECNIKGELKERLCIDGLVFEITQQRCDYPSKVNCTDRPELQTPKPGKNCPRANGFFPFPAAESCQKFWDCREGKAYLQVCPAGVIFDNGVDACATPDQTNRVECNASKFLGFECPVYGPEQQLRFGNHERLSNPKDCQQFFSCLRTGEPRLGACPKDTVFSDETGHCAEPETVPGCETYWKDKEEENEDDYSYY